MEELKSRLDKSEENINKLENRSKEIVRVGWKYGYVKMYAGCYQESRGLVER